MKFLKLCMVVPLFVVLNFSNAYADDKEDVVAAVKDYVLGFYEGDAERLDRALHPTLRKLGWYRDGGDKPYGGPYPMTKERALSFAPRFGNSPDSPGSNGHLKVVVFEVLDKVASAKVEASWGIDYIHLAKTDGKWMIYNVIWQSHPDGKERR